MFQGTPCESWLFCTSSIHFNSSLLLTEKSQTKKKTEDFKCEYEGSRSKPAENNFKEFWNDFKGNTEHSDPGKRQALTDT